MEIILLQDVKGTGKKGQKLEVSDGHARNFLIPRKLAIEATKSNVAQLESQQKKADHKHREEVEAAQAIGNRVRETEIKIPVRVGEGGKMFGSIGNKEVAEALVKSGISIDKKKIVVDSIKTVGEHKATVKLHPQVSVILNFEVVAE